MSENKAKSASKSNFVLIERRGGKDDLCATEINAHSASSVVESKNEHDFLKGTQMSQPRRPSAQASSLIDSLNESSDLPDPDADELLVTKELDVVIPDMTERRSDAPTKEDTTH